MLGWAPQTPLKVGLHRTYEWIKKQIENERAKGIKFDYLESKVVEQDATVLDQLYDLIEDDKN